MKSDFREFVYPYSYIEALNLKKFITFYEVVIYDPIEDKFLRFDGSELDYFNLNLLEGSDIYFEVEDDGGFHRVDLKDKLLDILNGKLPIRCCIEKKFNYEEIEKK